MTAIYLRHATARAGDTLESLGEREANVVRLDLLAAVNGLAADATLAEGQVIRIGRREPYRPQH